MTDNRKMVIAEGHLGIVLMDQDGTFYYLESWAHESWGFREVHLFQYYGNLAWTLEASELGVHRRKNKFIEVSVLNICRIQYIGLINNINCAIVCTGNNCCLCNKRKIIGRKLEISTCGSILTHVYR